MGHFASSQALGLFSKSCGRRDILAARFPVCAQCHCVPGLGLCSVLVLPSPSFSLARSLVGETRCSAALRATSSLSEAGGKSRLHSLCCFWPAFQLPCVLRLLLSPFAVCTDPVGLWGDFLPLVSISNEKQGDRPRSWGVTFGTHVCTSRGMGGRSRQTAVLVFCPVLWPHGIKTLLPPLSLPPKAPVTTPLASPGP